MHGVSHGRQRRDDDSRRSEGFVRPGSVDEGEGGGDCNDGFHGDAGVAMTTAVMMLARYTCKCASFRCLDAGAYNYAR